MNQRVWLVIGRANGFGQAMTKYLQSRKQVVIPISGFHNLLSDLKNIVHRHDAVDMLIVHDLERDAAVDTIVGDVYKISSLMRRDGTSRIIFFLPEASQAATLQKETAYQTLERDMESLAIEIKCFGPGS
jgi:short-subunit dehydrogenase